MLSSKLKLLAKHGSQIRASSNYSPLIKNMHYYTSRTDDEVSESSLNQSADVSLSLAKHVITSTTFNKEANVVLSPLSINIVLGMIAAGSDGPTQNQILGFVKSKSIEQLNSLSSKIVTHVFADGGPLGGPCLSAANAVWVDQNLRFKSSFDQIVRQSYKAASRHVDFWTKAEEVRKKVNAWADKETNGLIKDVLPPGSVSDLTRLIFANAMYFKGVWLDKFDASMTKDRDFFLLSGRSIKVPFMTSREEQYISEFDGFKVLELPYKQGQDYNRRFSMYFFLPDTKDGLPDLLEKVSTESGFIKNHRPHDLVKVGDFRIPKFKIGFDFEASEVLKELGVVLPFCMGGLTEMVDSTIDGKELHVDGIFHKAFIEVNEKGTEAAAVSLGMSCGGAYRPMKIKKLDFVADHPFLFVIRENFSGAVLFIGQLLDPLS